MRSSYALLGGALAAVQPSRTKRPTSPAVGRNVRGTAANHENSDAPATAETAESACKSRKLERRGSTPEIVVSGVKPRVSPLRARRGRGGARYAPAACGCAADGVCLPTPS